MHCAAVAVQGPRDTPQAPRCHQGRPGAAPRSVPPAPPPACTAARLALAPVWSRGMWNGCRGCQGLNSRSRLEARTAGSWSQNAERNAPCAPTCQMWQNASANLAASGLLPATCNQHSRKCCEQYRAECCAGCQRGTRGRVLHDAHTCWSEAGGPEPRSRPNMLKKKMTTSMIIPARLSACTITPHAAQECAGG